MLSKEEAKEAKKLGNLPEGAADYVGLMSDELLVKAGLIRSSG